MLEELSKCRHGGTGDDEVSFDDTTLKSVTAAMRQAQGVIGSTYIHTLAQAMTHVASRSVNIAGRIETRTTEVTTVRDPIPKMMTSPIFCRGGI